MFVLELDPHPVALSLVSVATGRCYLVCALWLLGPFWVPQSPDTTVDLAGARAGAGPWRLASGESRGSHFLVG